MEKYQLDPALHPPRVAPPLPSSSLPPSSILLHKTFAPLIVGFAARPPRGRSASSGIRSCCCCRSGHGAPVTPSAPIALVGSGPDGHAGCAAVAPRLPWRRAFFGNRDGLGCPDLLARADVEPPLRHVGWTGGVTALPRSTWCLL